MNKRQKKELVNKRRLHQLVSIKSRHLVGAREPGYAANSRMWAANVKVNMDIVHTFSTRELEHIVSLRKRGYDYNWNAYLDVVKVAVNTELFERYLLLDKKL